MFVVAARAAGSHAPFLRLLPLMMLALFAMTLPVNIGGWGPREGVTAWAFGAAGLGATQGLTIAVLYGLFAFIAALPGVVVIVGQWAAKLTAVRRSTSTSMTRSRQPAVSEEFVSAAAKAAAGALAPTKVALTATAQAATAKATTALGATAPAEVAAGGVASVEVVSVDRAPIEVAPVETKSTGTTLGTVADGTALAGTAPAGVAPAKTALIGTTLAGPARSKTPST